jgi:hypothetical protein
LYLTFNFSSKSHFGSIYIKGQLVKFSSEKGPLLLSFAEREEALGRVPPSYPL